MPGRSAFRCSGFSPTERSPAPWPRRMAAAAVKLKVGDPTLPDTAVGPVIRPSEVRRVAQWVDEAVGGAERLCGTATSPLPFGRGAGGEGRSGRGCRRSTCPHPSLSPKGRGDRNSPLSLRERGLG